MESEEIKLTESAHILRLDPGDDLINCITEYVHSHNIRGGTVNVIGALGEVKLGYFSTKKGDYVVRHLIENFELLPSFGNISWVDGKEPLVHLHLIVGRYDYSTLGGHCLPGCIVSLTAEVIIIPTIEKIIRKKGGLHGLKLLSFGGDEE